jgi:hypothetical protein
MSISQTLNRMASHATTLCFSGLTILMLTVVWLQVESTLIERPHQFLHQNDSFLIGLMILSSVTALSGIALGNTGVPQKINLLSLRSWSLVLLFLAMFGAALGFAK